VREGFKCPNHNTHVSLSNRLQSFSSSSLSSGWESCALKNHNSLKISFGVTLTTLPNLSIRNYTKKKIIVFDLGTWLRRNWLTNEDEAEFLLTVSTVDVWTCSQQRWYCSTGRKVRPSLQPNHFQNSALLPS
jgi:hypothetical protein